MIERRPLTDEDVRRLVFGAVELIREAQASLSLPLSLNIQRTRRRLLDGDFWADTVVRGQNCRYGMDFGCFNPPNNISLDKELPFSDAPLDLPDLASTLTLYSAVHEVVHADDYVGGDKLLKATRDHMVENHEERMEDAMRIIEENADSDCIRSVRDLADLSAQHYVDMVTHFRSYVVLRYAEAPQLDQIWYRLSADYFPPYLLTRIEREKGTGYVFDLFTSRAGDYCLIEAFEDYEAIGKRQGGISIV